MDVIRRRSRRSKPVWLGLLLVVAACGGDGGETTATASPAETTPPSAATSEVIQAAQEAGSIKIGTIVTPPWVLREPGETEFSGPEPLYMEKVAEELGVEIEWVDSSWETIIQGLEAGQFDIAAAPLNPTEERRQVADFAVFTAAGYCYLVKADSDLQTIEDIGAPGVDIATLAGTALIGLMEEAFPEATISPVTPPPGANENVEDVLTGRHDVTIINSPEVYGFEQRFAGELRVIPSGDECFNNPHLSTPIGVAIRKGDPVLLQLLEDVHAEHADEIEAEDKRATESLTVDG